jgi:hypothetical protein
LEVWPEHWAQFISHGITVETQAIQAHLNTGTTNDCLNGAYSVNMSLREIPVVLIQV